MIAVATFPNILTFPRGDAQRTLERVKHMLGGALGGAGQVGAGLGVGRGAAAVANWWEAGGATGCVAAYQPKGAASLAASKVNLANPGTYDAFGAVPPTFNTSTGWTFDGISQVLATGIMPTIQDYTGIVQFSGVSGGGGTWMFGGFGSRLFGIQPIDDQGSPNVAYLNGSFVRVSPSLTSGNLAIAGNQGYRNGIADGGTIASGTGTHVDVYIGALNNGGGDAGHRSCVIQAIAFYNNVLTSGQVAAVATAMAAL